LDEHSGVNRHVIHTLCGLLFNNFEHYLGVQVLDSFHAGDGFVNGYSSNGNGRMPQDRFANIVDVATGREIHHRIGAVVDSCVQLFQFFVDLGADCRVADIRIDLAQRGHADGHGLEFGMVDIGRDDHPAAGHFVAHQFGRDLLFMRNERHFLRDGALARVMHLGKVAVAIVLLAPREPLRAGFGDTVAVAVGAIGGSHENPSFRKSL